MKYRIELWEPAVVPGGYCPIYEIEAPNAAAAIVLALRKGYTEYPACELELYRLTAMEQPELNYIKHDFAPHIYWECPICSALVFDTAKHSATHE